MRGIRQFVVGTGGGGLHSSRQTLPNSEVRIAAFGVLKLTLAVDAYEWEFIPVLRPERQRKRPVPLIPGDTRPP